MPSGKRLPPARYALPLRLAAAIPLGTLFVGSGLVGLPGPAAAASDPAAPVLSFDPAAVAVEPGETAETVLRIDPGDAEGTVCLYDLILSNAGFSASGPDRATPPATAEISGQTGKQADVRASIAYTEVEENAPCPEEPDELLKSTTQDAFAVTVESESPDPSPTTSPDPEPTPSPTGSPDPSPTGSPDPSPTGSPDPSPTGSADPSPTGSADPSPSPTGPGPTSSATGGNQDGDGGGPEPESGDGGGGGSSNGGSDGSSGSDSGGSGGGGATAPPHSPVSTGGESDPGAGAGADLPELPTGAPDLPGLDSPSEDGPLADLPSVEPGERDSAGTTEVAAREQAPASMVTPAVLVLFLVLLLLFSTPLAPSRRVRIGPSTYKGRRRRH
ncbi:hypothetical protein [Streptomonospora wellingtoniae]|uniref:Uncharacterized protein n=1 Tax=Streptomonospora wellingtoniae TaxID=3075544 RepID=A0ABU2KYT4_9ACTN|nr:hypothetical protein [Streptomonospora sp. DSM 45055]MDT0304469.1 hypothetical protein [Streptomonospora sp. DSM 45055]